MRTSSPRSTSCCPASDVKFVARTPALGCGPLSALCAQPRVGRAGEQGRVGVVLLAGFEPASPLGHVNLNHARVPISPQEQTARASS